VTPSTVANHKAPTTYREDLDIAFDELLMTVGDMSKIKLTPMMIDSLLLEYVYKTARQITNCITDEMESDDRTPTQQAADVIILDRIRDAWDIVINGPEITSAEQLREVLGNFLKEASTNSLTELLLLMKGPIESFTKTATIYGDLLDFMKSHPRVA
jgi:hypothetical protein